MSSGEVGSNQKKLVWIFVAALLLVPIFVSVAVARAQCNDSWLSRAIGVNTSCKVDASNGYISFADANGKQTNLDLSELANFVKEQKKKGTSDSDFDLSMYGNMLTISANGKQKAVDLSGFADNIVNDPNGDDQVLKISGKVLTIRGGNSINLAPFLSLADYSAGDGITVSGSRVISSVLGTSINNAEIEDSAVTNAKIADGTIRFSKLNDNDCQGGQIIKYSGTDWTCGTGISVGDVKSGMQTTDHGGWVKLDGRALTSLTEEQQVAAEALGLTGNLPNATNAFLAQNGTTLGSVSGSNSRTLAQNQLPNATLNGTTSSAGAHSHSYDRSDTDGAVYPVGGGTHALATNPQSTSTSTSGAHTHTFTTSSINGGVAQQPLSVTPQSLSVTMFIYLGL